MNIIYAQNPLLTTVELDEHESKAFWYRIKIEKLEGLLFTAHFHLQGDQYHNLDHAKKALDPAYYLSETNDPAEMDKRVDELHAHYVDELRGGLHIGDCTCVACSCSKCHAESVLGIDTINGLRKHPGHKIAGAFGKGGKGGIDDALAYLRDYDPKPSGDMKAWADLGGYEQYVPRWKAEAAEAYEWLLAYRAEHFPCARDRSAKHQDAKRLDPEGAEPGRVSDAPKNADAPKDEAAEQRVAALEAALKLARGALMQCSPCEEPACRAEQGEWLEAAIRRIDAALSPGQPEPKMDGGA